MNGFFRSLGPTLMAISGWAAEPLFSLPSTPAPPPAVTLPTPSPVQLARLRVEAETGDWRPGRQRTFLLAIAPLALVVAAEMNLPPSLLLAQAAHESGWGRSRPARELNNLFGHTRRDGLVEYADWEASVRAHAELLGRSPKYAAARAARSWRPALRALAAVYAADPEYAPRVAALVDQWGLDRWDADFVARTSEAS